MVINFFVNPHLFLALAQQSPEPIERALRQLPQIPAHSHWAYFLRNHDELDLSRLSKSERDTCFRAFGPKPKMQIFQRGIRRRLAPMVSGRLELQLLLYSLIFTIPETPILWYGEEIGMGDALGLEERNSVRTPKPRKLTIELWEKTFDHFVHNSIFGRASFGTGSCE